MAIELNKVVLALAVAMLLGISSARAEEGPVGKVRGLYAEAARGVMVEGARAGAASWAEVDFGAGSAQPRRRVMVRLPADLAVQTGDLVAVRLARPPMAIGMLAPMPEMSRATQIAAKWFTPQAEAFNAAPRRMLSLN